MKSSNGMKRRKKLGGGRMQKGCPSSEFSKPYVDQSLNWK